MDPAFWKARWQEGRTAFHEGRPNAFLSRHADWFAGCRRVLVPLCGKTEDLAYLASRGHEVIGVELVEDAARQFFDEHATTPTITTAEGMTIYGARSITILAGDLFATTASLVGAVDGIYDRAALVALPDQMRTRYTEHLRAIAPSATRELLITLTYPPGSAEGPPFSVDDAAVRALFPHAHVQFLEEAPYTRGRDGEKMTERCYAIKLTDRPDPE
ncbi:MAG: thiopurine S-methyltransferase [Kofleriaceae bacterium]